MVVEAAWTVGDLRRVIARDRKENGHVTTVMFSRHGSSWFIKKTVTLSSIHHDHTIQNWEVLLSLRRHSHKKACEEALAILQLNEGDAVALA